MKNAHVASPPWFDAAMPEREQCVLGPLLDHWAATAPDRVFAIFEDGASWTWQEARAEVRGAAQALQHLGVSKGDTVLVWLPNGRAMLRAWFASNYLGNHRGHVIKRLRLIVINREEVHTQQPPGGAPNNTAHHEVRK